MRENDILEIEREGGTGQSDLLDFCGNKKRPTVKSCEL